MQLKNIKLSGFKSFVDPLTITFPSPLIAVVGPNGCGKSNIIDAIRWVMGEISAKQLRGESMTDVIFNGSTGRKPAGFASVELTFDNSDGKLGGEYAAYSTIAVRREVSRDGQSDYFLNGSKCRRRDVTGVFLGTGLGPRSYAIIKQDTISRIIEAKPEELRVYIEEAAGISRYKERRKETETRMRHTRENLARLSDMRSELDKQLTRLQTQAEAADKYKRYKEELRVCVAEYQALQWREYTSQFEQYQLQTSESQTKLEETIAEIRRIESQSVSDREQLHEHNAELQTVQSQFYQIGNEVSRLEQDLEHRKERIAQFAMDKQVLEQDREAMVEHQSADTQTLTEIGTELSALTPELEKATVAASAANESLVSVEAGLREWEDAWHSFKEDFARNQQIATSKQREIQLCEQRIRDCHGRIERNQAELIKCDTQEEAQLLETYQAEKHAIEEALETQQVNYYNAKSALTINREKNRELSSALDETKTELQQTLGKQVSLTALQQAALGENEEATMAWLKQHDIEDKPRLAQSISVEPGWERAVEVVLAERTAGVCVDNFDALARSAVSAKVGNLTLINTEKVDGELSDNAQSLLTKVTSPFSVRALLENIFIAIDTASALAMLPGLSAGQSVVTQDGYWFGPSWLRICEVDETRAGVLQREKELAGLEIEVARLEQLRSVLSTAYESGRQKVDSLEKEQEAAQSELNTLKEKLALLEAKIQVKQARMAQKQERIKNIELENTESEQTIADIKIEYEQLREVWQQALTAVEQASYREADLASQGEERRAGLDSAKQAVRRDQDCKHQIELQIQSLQSRLSATQLNLERVEIRLQDVNTRIESITAQVTETSAPLADLTNSLQSAVDKRLAVEATMRGARQKVEEVESRLSGQDEKRMALEEKSEAVRQELDERRMQLKTIEVKQKTLEEQFAENDFTMSDLLDALDENAKASDWSEKTERIERRIQRLGAINLAAIEECQIVLERKTYLDAQNEDLEQALTTLENAIRKIDNETRSRFKETVQRVDEDFQLLFPKIFNGGAAHLELTEGDLLEAGVLVKARPPGKRNTTIHLLSGGEKALTAIALVFSIFRLNPAPFCMLDEVDAPLDDANVTRFCNLVKEMSETIQFIFITHNKVTMELAQQLLGVTMKEPGVSRLVSVDVEDAVAMAEA